MGQHGDKYLALTETMSLVEQGSADSELKYISVD